MSETQVTTETQVVDTDDLDAFASDFFGEKKQAEPTAKSEANPEEGVDANQDGEATEAVETEAQETENDPNEDPNAEYKEAPPKKKTVQDRIDELVRQREEQKREFQRQLDEQKAEFERQLQAVKPTQPVQKTAEPTPDALDEVGNPKYALGEFDPAYIRDLTRFTLEQERNETNAKAEAQRQQEAETARLAGLQSTWNEKLEASLESYPDLREKGQVLLDGFSNLDPNYAAYLATVLMSMDYGPDVLNYLSDNPTEARTIVNSGAQKATIALGRIEAKFLEAAAQKIVAKPKVSKAPPPPPVQARGTAGGSKIIPPDTDNLDDFDSIFYLKRK
jgi:hypothetical protein